MRQMAVRYSPEWLDELRARVNIVSVVSEQVTLKQNGRRYWGLCPFHSEKTASFSVDSESQLYYCFGCKAGGDVIHFVMETERLDFSEAVRHLAERVHLALPQADGSGQEEERRKLKDILYAMNRDAALFYHSLLWKPEGEETLAYFYRRGLTDATIRKFGLGASPQGWDGLLRHLSEKGYEPELMHRAGLLSRKEDHFFDMFRARAMFPILSARGEVLGFGGRALGDAQPKYLNTTDTPVFNKRMGLYAVSLLRKVRNLARLILVEGYMDVVSLTQHGVQGVVATLGTALTLEQAQLMRRYAPEVCLAYDGDEAGQKAILRGLDILDPLDLRARVLVFPEGMDPDDFIRKEGLSGFEALTPISAPLFRMRRVAKALDLSLEDDRTQYAIECAAILRKVREPVEAENLLQRLMVDTGYPREVLLRQIGQNNAMVAEHRNTVQPMRDMLHGTRGFMPDDVKAGRQLLSLMASGRVRPGTVELDDFTDPLHREIARRLIAGESAAAIVSSYEADERREDVLIIFGEEPRFEEEQLLRMVNDYLERMRLRKVEARINTLKASLAQAEGSARAEGIQELASLTLQHNRLKSGRKE